MEPVARLLETSHVVWSAGHVTPDKFEESMAQSIAGKSSLGGSPASITSLLAEDPPDELFLPPRYGAKRDEASCPPRAAFVPINEQQLVRGQTERAAGRFVPLLKGESLSLHDALQHKEWAVDTARLASLLVGSQASLEELVCSEDDSEDEDE